MLESLIYEKAPFIGWPLAGFWELSLCKVSPLPMGKGPCWTVNHVVNTESLAPKKTQANGVSDELPGATQGFPYDCCHSWSLGEFTCPLQLYSGKKCWKLVPNLPGPCLCASSLSLILLYLLPSGRCSTCKDHRLLSTQRVATLRGGPREAQLLTVAPPFPSVRLAKVRGEDVYTSSRVAVADQRQPDGTTHHDQRLQIMSFLQGTAVIPCFPTSGKTRRTRYACGTAAGGTGTLDGCVYFLTSYLRLPGNVGLLLPWWSKHAFLPLSKVYL